MASPVKVIVFIIFSRVVVASSAGALATIDVIEIPPCDEWTDVITGCGDTRNALLAASFGSIPGAPSVVNLILVGVTNLMLLWSVIAFVRGIVA